MSAPHWEAWLFDEAEALPTFHAEERVATAVAELGASRVIAAAAAVGMERAVSSARELGPYELADELADRLRLEGLQLGAEGAVPGLDRAAWPAALDLEPYGAFRTRVEEEGGEVRGLRLRRSDRAAFERFLRAGGASPVSPWDLLDLARHFFHREPLKVVTYTGPRLNRP